MTSPIKRPKLSKNKIDGKKISTLVIVSGLVGFLTQNPLLVLAASFITSVILDPIAITYLSNSWEGSIGVRLTNATIGLFLGLMVWVFVWLGTRFSTPVFYAPAWGFFYIMASVVIPTVLNNGWSKISPIMWVSLLLGVLFLGFYLFLAAKVGLLRD